MNNQRLLRTAVASASFLAAAGTLLAATTAFAATTTPSTYHVMVMTHLCNNSIKNADDFDAMENGLGPVAALATDVLACPTTGLANNAAVAGTVAAPRTAYDFKIMTGAQTQTMSTAGTYVPIKVSEADLNMDVNHDGQISSTTALDISHYDVPVTASGSDAQIHVDETMAPAGYHFGILRFTPVALDANNDSESLKYLDPTSGHIHLNMVTDKDGMIMLHVYQFANAGGAENGGGMGTGTTTGTTGTTSTGTAFGASIRASVQAQIQAIQARIQAILSQSFSGGTSSSSTHSSMTTMNSGY